METTSFMDLLLLVNFGGLIVLLLAFHSTRKKINEIVGALNVMTVELLKLKMGDDKVRVVDSQEEIDAIIKEISEKVDRDDQ